MPPKVTIKQQQRGSALKLLWVAVTEGSDTSSFISDGILVDDLAVIRLRFKMNNTNQMALSVSVKKKDTSKNSSVNMNISGLNIENQQLPCLDNWSHFKIISRIACDFDIGIKKGESDIVNIRTFTQEVNVNVLDVTHNTQKHEALYKDTTFTDLELCATDGSVAVHKGVVASHSELFRTLFSDPSKKVERRFPVQGVNVETLQQLKDYMYLGSLPLQGLPQLLVVAVHGKMDRLKYDCINKMASLVTAVDVDALINFAIQHNIPELMQAMLSLTSDSVVHDAHRNRRRKLNFTVADPRQLALEYPVSKVIDLFD